MILRAAKLTASNVLLIAGLVVSFLTGSCSVDSARNHYVLAEKLWTDRKYPPAVSEFEKVISKDPHGKLGLQALYRAAMTQSLFLSQYADAIRKFKGYAQEETDQASVWNAQLQIGEILYSKTEQYDQAILHYRALLKSGSQAPELPELLFRVGKSHFFLFQFNDSVTTYKELIQAYPKSVWAEKAAFEIGETYFTRGEQTSEGIEAYTEAINAYKRFIQHYPKSELATRAQFGIASCLEELDQHDNAYTAYSSLKKTYPSPNVIDIKLTRIHERMTQKNGSK